MTAAAAAAAAAAATVIISLTRTIWVRTLWPGPLRPIPWTLGAAAICGTGVCEKNTPPEKKTFGEIIFRSTKSGAGGQVLLQDCRAKAGIQEVFSFSQTPVRFHWIRDFELYYFNSIPPASQWWGAELRRCQGFNTTIVWFGYGIVYIFKLCCAIAKSIFYFTIRYSSSKQ